MQSLSHAAAPRRAPLYVALLALVLVATIPIPSLADIEGPAFDGETHHGPSAHALRGARIVQAPGRVIETGTLVIRDGIIVAVGADVEIPADAKVWELEDATLYPGLIETFSTLDVPEPGEDEPAAGGAHPNPMVRPERSAALHAGAADVKKLRAAGFTVAVLVPEPGILRGESVAIATGDGDLGHNRLRGAVAQNVRFRTLGFGAGYPTSIMGAMALLRQVTADARWHADAHRAHGADPSQGRPAYSTSLEAFADAAHGRQKVVFEASDLDQLLQIADLAEELELDALVVATGEEYRRLGEVKATGLTLLLPVSFPKDPKVSDDDDLTVELETLRHWKMAPENPQRLLEAGVPFVLTSHHLSDPKQIHEHLQVAVERGLDPDAALAALTTGPAELLGLANRVGTLEVGKAAHIVVTEGDLFAEKTKIRDVWVDGRPFELKDIKPPTVDPVGTWEILIQASGGFEMPATVIFTGTVDDLGGRVESPQGNLAITSAEVSGDTVYVEVDMAAVGAPGSLNLDMKIEGESVSGSGTSPQGEFTFTGTRTVRPEPVPEVIR